MTRRVLLLGVLCTLAAQAQVFQSGSDGSDGALDYSWASSGDYYLDPKDPATFDPGSGRELDADNDNVFHFTSINIPYGVRVYLRAPQFQWQPVYWLCSGGAVINGTINLNGEDGHDQGVGTVGRFPAVPGPGGFPGGVGASNFNLPTPGFGPGGGAVSASTSNYGGYGSFATLGYRQSSSAGLPGSTYGNAYLLPLIGGSGGAGGGENTMTGDYGGGGAGGGAFLLACDGPVDLNGYITAEGGSGGSYAGYGSGGAVRILTPDIVGSGYIRVDANYNDYGTGRIRLETLEPTISLYLHPNNNVSVVLTRLVPNTPFLPSDPRLPGWPSVTVTEIGGVTLSSRITGDFTVPDATVPDGNPVTVLFQSRNVPTNAAVQLQIISSDYSFLTLNPTFVSGTAAQAVWTADVAFPLGFSRGYLQATWSP